MEIDRKIHHFVVPSSGLLNLVWDSDHTGVLHRPDQVEGTKQIVYSQVKL